MAEFRIDQPGGAGVGVAGRSRVDLVAGFVIELHATPVVGATFTWEIVDKVNTNAALTGTSGLTVNIGTVGGDITEFSGFLVRLTQNVLGVVTVTERVVALRATVSGLRPPLFGESAPQTQTLTTNDPDLSTDNAEYPDLAGRGSPGQNPFGWREWAWEVVKQVETVAATLASFSGNDRHQARFIVGNATSGDTAEDCHFLDAGDGAGIEAALLAANLYAQACDVYLRDGTYGAGLVPPFAVPGGCRVSSGAPGSAIIIGSATQRTTFSLGYGALLENLAIAIAEGSPGAMTGTEVVSGSDSVLRNLIIFGTFVNPADATETLTAVIRTTGGYYSTLEGNLIVMPSRADAGTSPIIGIHSTNSCSRIYGNRIFGGDTGVRITNGNSCTVTGNVFAGLVMRGLWLDSAEYTAVGSNVFEAVGSGLFAGPSYGVVADGNSYSNAISGNTIRVGPIGASAAIRLDSTTNPGSGGNTVTGNVLNCEQGVAVELSATEAGSTVVGNSLRGGVINDLGTGNEIAHNNPYIAP